jgi:putative transcriptional regulator
MIQKLIKNGTKVTKLGEYLTKKSVNKAIVARKTGLSKQRMGELTLNSDAKLRAHEVYLIALAIGVDPCELFIHVCEGLKLNE